MDNRMQANQSTTSSRRDFIRGSAAGLLAAAGLGTLRAEVPQPMPVDAIDDACTQLTEHLFLFRGSINVGVIRNGDAAWLIDLGDGAVVQTLERIGVQQIERILFTHYHRDQLCGIYGLTDEVKVSAPAAEQGYFTQPADYWNDDGNLYRVYRSYRPDHLMPTRPIVVDTALAEGDEMEFGPAKIRVLATPGHTDGSLSYQVDVDGRRIVFCGDAICGDGQVWDLYSLQKGFSKNGKTIGGYHGFMGDRWTLEESLERLGAAEPDALVPSHGNLVREPKAAMERLATRFEQCYENYVSISALRHYFPKLFQDYEGKPGQMPLRPGIAPPECLQHFGTTWMLVSQSGAAFVMDAGSVGVASRLEEMLDTGAIKSIDALWVTHYHHDHTGGIPTFQEKFDCPCYTDKRLAEVLVNPEAWRLPCLAAEPIRVDHALEDGHSWQWQEFRLTSYFYPGQTLYHAALLVEHEDLRMLFVGDSHTMGGLDDYCAQNRNFLGRGVGFQYCLSLIEKLKPTHMFNCHVQDAFTFTPDEIQFMRRQLDERERLFGDLVPWDHANYGTDASWVRCMPYKQQLKAGDVAKFDVVVTNHSTGERGAACRVVPPAEFDAASSGWTDRRIPAKHEGQLSMQVAVPADTPPGRYVVPVDLQYDGKRLPQFTEALIDVVDG